MDNNPNYDADLAKKLNADEYGMKMFIFVMLVTGPCTNEDPDFRNSCFQSHMENINSLVAQGKIIVAGPFERENEFAYRGIFIFDSDSKEEVMSYLEDDKTIKEGIFIPQIIQWYGPAALAEYLAFSDKTWKVQH